MTITAKIIADSISDQKSRLTTMQLRYPKFIHGELMTHRVFSRNASSSRAIPVERLIQDVIDDPAMPVFWGKNQQGMQAADTKHMADIEFCAPSEDWEYQLEQWKIYPPGDKRKKDAVPYWLPINADAPSAWLNARDRCVEIARAMAVAGYHKQIVNRIIEPWCHINVVVTSTEWENFFALRCHPAAQPEMRVLAEAMRDAMANSVPKHCDVGGWHLPYYDPEVDGKAMFMANLGGDPFEWMIKVSVARCARVSYLTQDGRTPNFEEDLKLYDRLVGSEPLHASPAEHQATPDEYGYEIGAQSHDGGQAIKYPGKHWRYPEQHGNFVGWRQWRKMLPNENVKDR